MDYETDLKKSHQRYLAERDEIKGKYLEDHKGLDETYLNKIDTLEATFMKELATLEAKYPDMYQALNPKRYEEQVKKIPTFWLTALKNNDVTAKKVFECDEEALKYMKDIKCCRVDNTITKGFRLDFLFDPNPFFGNSVLTKKYHMNDQNKVVPEGTKIDWFPGKCLVKCMKGSKTENEECESFFNFFSPARISEEDDDDNSNAADLKNVMEQDYNMGLTLSDKVIPHAILWLRLKREATENEYGDKEEIEDDEEDDNEEVEQLSDDNEEVKDLKQKIKSLKNQVSVANRVKMQAIYYAKNLLTEINSIKEDVSVANYCADVATRIAEIQATEMENASAGMLQVINNLRKKQMIERAPKIAPKPATQSGPVFLLEQELQPFDLERFYRYEARRIQLRTTSHELGKEGDDISNSMITKIGVFGAIYASIITYVLANIPLNCCGTIVIGVLLGFMSLMSLWSTINVAKGRANSLKINVLDHVTEVVIFEEDVKKLHESALANLRIPQIEDEVIELQEFVENRVLALKMPKLDSERLMRVCTSSISNVQWTFFIIVILLHFGLCFRYCTYKDISGEYEAVSDWMKELLKYVFKGFGEGHFLM